MNGSGRYVWDKETNQIQEEPDPLVWAAWMATADRVVAKDRDESGASHVEVSTVFIGLDHAHGLGPPILWETMVFGGPHNGEQRRYRTLEEALAGHQEMCRLVAGKPGPARKE